MADRLIDPNAPMTVTAKQIVDLLEEFYKPYLDKVANAYIEDVNDLVERGNATLDQTNRLHAEMIQIHERMTKMSSWIVDKVLAEGTIKDETSAIPEGFGSGGDETPDFSGA